MPKHDSLCVKTIDHITIVVKDLQKSSEFYQSLLGMDEVERPRFGFPGKWFQAGITQIHMNVQSDDAGTAGLPPGDAKVLSRAFHYAFEVNSCDDAAQLIRDKGWTIAIEPRSRPDGARQLYIHDPDGHLVEIYSRS